MIIDNHIERYGFDLRFKLSIGSIGECAVDENGDGEGNRDEWIIEWQFSLDRQERAKKVVNHVKEHRLKQTTTQ